MQIIKDQTIIDNQWQHFADDDAITGDYPTISMSRWKAERDSLIARFDTLGVRISPEDTVGDISSDLDHFDLVCLDFPVFTDGRLFSTARLLRSRYQYHGELRAIGNFIRDQIFFLSRVGVNAFELRDSDDITEALNGLSEFSVSYQISSAKNPV